MGIASTHLLSGLFHARTHDQSIAFERDFRFQMSFTDDFVDPPESEEAANALLNDSGFTLLNETTLKRLIEIIESKKKHE